MFEKIGVGIDIIEIYRFREKPYQENKHFYKKLFHESEIKYCLNQKNSSQSFAAKFAIKESVKKSIHKQIDFLEILTNHIDSKPNVTLLNDSSYNFHVSVSHEQFNAVAVVISEKTD